MFTKTNSKLESIRQNFVANGDDDSEIHITELQEQIADLTPGFEIQIEMAKGEDAKTQTATMIEITSRLSTLVSDALNSTSMHRQMKIHYLHQLLICISKDLSIQFR